MAGRSMSVSVLYLLGICTLASATKFVCTEIPDDGTTYYRKCADGTTHADANTRAVDRAFARSNVTDVVFLVDRSKGMSEGNFETMKNSIATLMDYLMLRRLVYLHPDYTRVSVVSFGQQSMVEFDGITSNLAPVHACNFDDKLAGINLGTAGRFGTNLASALSVTEKIFESSPRNDANRIMWVFTDGDTNCSSASRKMKGEGVTVFSAGVGEWMHMAAREDSVDDANHYACAKDWTSMMKDAIRDIRSRVDEKERTLYVTDDTYTRGRCSACQHCVCNVLDRRYTCARYDEMTTQTTLEVVDPTTHSPSHSPLAGNILLIVIIAGSATVFLLVVVVCCICCCCRRKRVKPPEVLPRVLPKSPRTGGGHTVQSHDSSDYDNFDMMQPVVAPRLTPRRTHDGHLINDDSHYTGHIESSRPDVVPRQEMGGHAQAEVEAETDTHSVHEGSLQLGEGAQNDHWLDQQVDPQSGLSPQSSVNYNYAYDFVLTGPAECQWQVEQTAQDHELQGLLIYNLDQDRHWAATRNFILPRGEINTIRRVLGGGGASFRVAGKTYTIDRNEFSDLHVHATNEAGDHVWAAVEGSYVIIGVAGPDKSKACEDVVFKFMQELDQCAKRKDEDTV